MTTESILIIELNPPDPQKRGQAYGEAARQKIHAVIDKYREIFQCITGETWETTMDRDESFLSKARAFASDLVEEIRGIADGADRALMEIFLLNARSEILFNRRVLAQKTISALNGSIDVKGIREILNFCLLTSDICHLTAVFSTNRRQKTDIKHY